MKLDGRIRTSDVRLKIDRLLREIGLIEKRDTRIGGTDDSKVLSGGEKKRLVFAAEVRVHAFYSSHFPLRTTPDSTSFLSAVDGS